MSGSPDTISRHFGNAEVLICRTQAALGAAAAARTAGIIQDAIRKQGIARIIVATGNSQLHFIAALMGRHDVDWSKVEAFHMDEYVGIPPDHPSSFHYWIKTRFADKATGARVHYLAGDAADIAGEIDRYSRLLNEAPTDLAFVGFGENGHIAFNDPAGADFDDPATIKVVELDRACRHQQVGEGHFKNLRSVPERAITVSCSGLIRSAAWICSVPEGRKAAAVRQALLGPISTSCPASIVRRHPMAIVFLDKESASLLSPRLTAGAASS